MSTECIKVLLVEDNLGDAGLLYETWFCWTWGCRTVTAWTRWW